LRGVLDLVVWAAAMCVTVVAVRLVWLYTVSIAVRAVDRRQSQRELRLSWRERLVVGWSGMRGAVSLAAALAVPLEADSGGAFPGRDLIIFLAFAVIVFSLVVQGLTLPLLIHGLGIEGDEDEEEQEEVAARLATAEAALARPDELDGEDWTRQDTVDRMRRLYDYRHRRFTARRDDHDGSDGIEEHSRAYQELTRELLSAQQEALMRLRKDGAIHDEVMRRVQRDLDLEDERLEI
jgi:NhaP-type Na+/H+ or K+/H+ antiporter